MSYYFNQQNWYDSQYPHSSPRHSRQADWTSCTPFEYGKCTSHQPSIRSHYHGNERHWDFNSPGLKQHLHDKAVRLYKSGCKNIFELTRQFIILDDIEAANTLQNILTDLTHVKSLEHYDGCIILRLSSKIRNICMYYNRRLSQLKLFHDTCAAQDSSHKSHFSNKYYNSSYIDSHHARNHTHCEDSSRICQARHEPERLQLQSSIHIPHNSSNSQRREHSGIPLESYGTSDHHCETSYINDIPCYQILPSPELPFRQKNKRNVDLSHDKLINVGSLKKNTSDCLQTSDKESSQIQQYKKSSPDPTTITSRTSNVMLTPSSEKTVSDSSTSDEESPYRCISIGAYISEDITNVAS